MRCLICDWCRETELSNQLYYNKTRGSNRLFWDEKENGYICMQCDDARVLEHKIQLYNDDNINGFLFIEEPEYVWDEDDTQTE